MSVHVFEGERSSARYRVESYLAKEGPDVLTDVGADGTQQEGLHL